MQADRVLGQFDQDVNAVVSGNTAFAFDLYDKLKQTEGNLFFSPSSISTALAITYAGASAATEQQMAQVLHFSLSQAKLHPAFASLLTRLALPAGSENVMLKIANSLWPQVGYPILESFQTLAMKQYGGVISQVDYQAALETTRSTINTWVEQKTEHKIKDLIKPGMLDKLARLVLVNAIYFKGNWASRFDTQLTHEALFRLSLEKTVAVSMMAQAGRFRCLEEAGCQILELPYAGGDLSMIILLPKQITGLSELENLLGAEKLKSWLQHLEERKVQVFLPGFKLSCEFLLNEALIALGMVDAFDPSKANFAGIDGREDWLYIDAAIHKAFVELNEEGTEAAAATAIVMRGRVAIEPTIFRADHPFVFLILDNRTQSILFLGRVVNPKVK